MRVDSVPGRPISWRAEGEVSMVPAGTEIAVQPSWAKGTAAARRASRCGIGAAPLIVDGVVGAGWGDDQGRGRQQDVDAARRRPDRGAEVAPASLGLEVVDRARRPAGFEPFADRRRVVLALGLEALGVGGRGLGVLDDGMELGGVGEPRRIDEIDEPRPVPRRGRSRSPASAPRSAPPPGRPAPRRGRSAPPPGWRRGRRRAGAGRGSPAVVAASATLRASGPTAS